MKTKALIPLLVLLPALCAGGCGKKEAAESASAASSVSGSVYRVRMSPPGYAPLNFRSATGSPQGFEHDILQEVAKRSGITFDYGYLPWAQLFAALEAGQADLLASGISITEERKAKYGMSHDYLEVSPVVIVTKDPKVKSFKDLAQRNVSVKRNSSHEKLLLELNKNNPDYAVYANSSWLTVKKVISDEAAGTLGDSSIMGSFVANHPNHGLRLVVDNGYAKDYYGFVVRKDDTVLLDKVNRALDSMKQDGTYQQIVGKWFKS